MEIQDLKARWEAGQVPNFKSIIAFIYNDPTQGESAVYDFLRTLDEDFGPQAYNQGLADFESVKSDAMLTRNNAEAMRLAMEKNAIEARKIEASRASNAQVQAVIDGNKSAAPVLEKVIEPLILKKIEVSNPSGGIAGNKQNLKPQTSTMLIFAAALALVGLLYYLTSKK